MVLDADDMADDAWKLVGFLTTCWISSSMIDMKPYRPYRNPLVDRLLCEPLGRLFLGKAKLVTLF